MYDALPQVTPCGSALWLYSDDMAWKLIMAIAFVLGTKLSIEAIQLTNAQYLRDHALTRGFMLGRPTAATVTADDKTVLFLRAEPRSAKLRLFEYDIDSKEAAELVTPEQLLRGAE